MKPSDMPFVTLLLQSWWMLVGLSAFLVIVVSVAGYLTGEMTGGGKKVVAAVELVNRVLRSWADYSEVQGIGGVPVGVEFNDANPAFLQPEQAVVVQLIGRKEIRYRVATEKHMNRGGRGRYEVRHSYTFEQVETPAELEE